MDMASSAPFIALGFAAVSYVAGLVFALRGEGATAAMLIILGAILTMASV